MNTYITLAIHTYDYAVALRDLLRAHDIDAQLENVDIKHPGPAAGIRVRIPETKLPQALRLIEHDQTTAAAAVIDKLEGEKSTLLLPVDFSEASYHAAKTAFFLASMLSLKVVIINVFATPYYDGSLSLTDNFTLDIRDSEVRKTLNDAAHEEMRRFKAKLEKMILDGEMPSAPYSATVREGIPEDVILEYTQQAAPQLVVMSTRSAAKKAEQSLGSVTAEVLDSCRVPVFTIPENFDFTTLSDLSPVAFFCNVDQHDLIAMDIFEKLAGAGKPNVFLVPVNEKSGNKLRGRMHSLTDYFAGRYPDSKFEYKLPDMKDLRASIEKLCREKKVKMLVVPNKKKNIFARLLNPGLAHKIVFASDAPMLALPV